jgi:flagellar motor switch protein FliG
MDRVKKAAIILLGIGDKHASEILKNMSPKEVRSILEAINTLENIEEGDVNDALNEFFEESDNKFGIDIVSKEQVKNSILSAVGNKGIGSFMNVIDAEKDKWLELIREQPMKSVVDLMQEEHPQIMTALVIIIFNYLSSDQGTELIKLLPKPLQNQIFKRMSCIGSMSKFGIDALAIFFDKELLNSGQNNLITVDGLETVANIISYLDSQTEHEIMGEIVSENKALGEQLQDRIFPFQRLAELDKKSMQILLSETRNEDLVIALKGVDESVRQIFLQNMSNKSAEILKDEMESKGPVKVVAVMDAQKRIIRLAKKLDEEEKIILSSKNNPDIVF